MSTIPLPHAAIVQSIQSVQPFAPGDILMIQSATTQANIPVLVLGINKLDPTQFILDTSTDPDTVKINVSAVVTGDPVWTPFTPTVTTNPAGPVTITSVTGRYVITGKTVKVSLVFTGSITATGVVSYIFAGFPMSLIGQAALSCLALGNPTGLLAAVAYALSGQIVVSRSVAFPAASEPTTINVSGVYELP